MELHPSVRLINGRIYRSAFDPRPAEALAISGGNIAWTGARRDVPDAGATIDLDGATVLPGLTDPHVHLFAIAAERLQADVASAADIGDVLDRLSDAARAPRGDLWVRGIGFDENRLGERRYPTRAELDAAVPDKPLVIRRFCGHTAVMNSAALRALGLSEGISDPDGGAYGRDAAGRLNGIAQESAAEAVFRAIPPLDRADVAASLRETVADAARMGLTAAVEAAVGFTSGFDEEFAIWGLLRRDRLPLRLGFMYQLDPPEAAARGLVAAADPDWQAMTLKFFADGIVGARTAAVSKPFADTGTCGFFMRDEHELEQMIVDAHHGGWQAAIHAIGDRAIARVLAAFARGQAERPRPDMRHRIEHYFCPPEDLLRLTAELGAVVVSQPAFLTRMRRSILGAFGADSDTKYPARSLLDAGVRFAASSDAPTGDPCPWAGMAAAIDRGARDGAPIGPAEALTRRQAVAAYVHGGAYAMKHESWRGELAPGMAADLIAIDRDPFDAAVDIRATRVRTTIVRGEVVHDVTGAGVAARAEPA